MAWKWQSATTWMKHLSCPSCISLELFFSQLPFIWDHNDASTDVAPSSVPFSRREISASQGVCVFSCDRSADIETSRQVLVETAGGMGLPSLSNTSHPFFCKEGRTVVLAQWSRVSLLSVRSNSVNYKSLLIWLLFLCQLLSDKGCPSGLESTMGMEVWNITGVWSYSSGIQTTITVDLQHFFSLLIHI